VQQLSQDVSSDADFLYDKAVFIGDSIKGALGPEYHAAVNLESNTACPCYLLQHIDVRMEGIERKGVYRVCFARNMRIRIL
jgi:hypothetical protein